MDGEKDWSVTPPREDVTLMQEMQQEDTERQRVPGSRRLGNILLQEHPDSFLKLMEAEAGMRGAGGAAALTGTLTTMGSKGSEAHLAQPSSFIPQPLATPCG